MLLTIHNLPANIRYADVKELLLAKCGLKELILDNLVPDGLGKRVTVGLAEEEDAAILVRKINGLYMNGQQLYVEDVRQKKAASEQPYRTVVQEQSMGYQCGAVQQPTMAAYPMMSSYAALYAPAPQAMPQQTIQNSYMGYGGIQGQLAQQASQYAAASLQSQFGEFTQQASTYTEESKIYGRRQSPARQAASYWDQPPESREERRRDSPQDWSRDRNEGPTWQQDYQDSRARRTSRPNERLEHSRGFERPQEREVFETRPQGDSGGYTSNVADSRNPNKRRWDEPDPYERRPDRSGHGDWPETERQSRPRQREYREEPQHKKVAGYRPDYDRDSRQSGQGGPPRSAPLQRPALLQRPDRPSRPDPPSRPSQSSRPAAPARPGLPFRHDAPARPGPSRPSFNQAGGQPAKKSFNVPPLQTSERQTEKMLVKQVKQERANRALIVNRVMFELASRLRLRRMLSTDPLKLKLRKRIGDRINTLLGDRRFVQPEEAWQMYNAKFQDEEQFYQSVLGEVGAKRAAVHDAMARPGFNAPPKQTFERQTEKMVEKELKQLRANRAHIVKRVMYELASRLRLRRMLPTDPLRLKLRKQIGDRINSLLGDRRFVQPDEAWKMYNAKFQDEEQFYQSVLGELESKRATAEGFIKPKTTLKKPPAPQLPPGKIPRYPEGDKKKHIQQKRMNIEEMNSLYAVEMNPKFECAIVEETNCIGEMFQKLFNEPEDNTTKMVYQNVSQSELIDKFKRLLALHLNRRLDNSGTKLVRIYGLPIPPKKPHLEAFLRQYGVLSLKKSDRKPFFIASLSSYDDVDKLCNMDPVTIGPDNISIQFKALQMTPRRERMNQRTAKKIRNDLVKNLIEISKVNLLDKNWQQQEEEEKIARENIKNIHEPENTTHESTDVILVETKNVTIDITADEEVIENNDFLHEDFKVIDEVKESDTENDATLESNVKGDDWNEGGDDWNEPGEGVGEDANGDDDAANGGDDDANADDDAANGGDDDANGGDAVSNGDDDDENDDDDDNYGFNDDQIPDVDLEDVDDDDLEDY